MANHPETTVVYQVGTQHFAVRTPAEHAAYWYARPVPMLRLDHPRIFPGTAPCGMHLPPGQQTDAKARGSK